MNDSTPTPPSRPEWMRATEAIRRMTQEALAGSSRALAQQLAQSYSSARLDELTKQMYDQTNMGALAKKLNEDLKRTYTAPNVSKLIVDSLQPFSAEALAGMADSLTRNYSQEMLKEINRTLDQISGTVLRSSFAGTWADAARTFEKEMETSGDPEPDEQGRQPSLGWWLATRPFLIQLDIILAALKVLDAYTKWVADASGQEANSPLQNAIVQDTMNVVFTVVTFLILYFNEKSKAQ